ncbi:MAG: hypothetical protein FWG82_00475 [Oscillospiraceae bacterium]|nr:hypothetical protein [Oscillospiraceae bacterium]
MELQSIVGFLIDYVQKQIDADAYGWSTFLKDFITLLLSNAVEILEYSYANSGSEGVDIAVGG